jgi:hypothetical protein
MFRLITNCLKKLFLQLSYLPRKNFENFLSDQKLAELAEGFILLAHDEKKKNKLNLDSNSDHVRIFGAVLGHLEAEIEFLIFHRK